MLFQTRRLTLRPFDPDSDDDVADAYAMYADPEVVRYLSGQVCPDLETQRSRLRERRAFYATLNNGTGVWAIVPRATGRIVAPRSSSNFLAPPPTSRTARARHRPL